MLATPKNKMFTYSFIFKHFKVELQTTRPKDNSPYTATEDGKKFQISELRSPWISLSIYVTQTKSLQEGVFSHDAAHCYLFLVRVQFYLQIITNAL